MLAIRLQRLGRKGYPVYRLAVQEAQRHPTSGRVVAYVGSYNPHTKQVTLNKDKISLYLKNGAQPSPRIVRLLEAEKVALPEWVKGAGKKQKVIRNLEKLRRNRPKESQPSDAKAVESKEESAEEAPAEQATEEVAAEEVAAETETKEATAQTSDSEDSKTSEETEGKA